MGLARLGQQVAPPGGEDKHELLPILSDPDARPENLQAALREQTSQVPDAAGAGRRSGVNGARERRSWKHGTCQYSVDNGG